MQLNLFGIEQPIPVQTKPKPPKQNWIDWTYTPDKPHPALPKKQIINIKLRDGWESSRTDERNKPFSYWFDDFNCFKWQKKYPLSDVIAYQVVSA